MTQYVCDRCASVHTKSLTQITVPEIKSQYYSKENKERVVDLCDSCVRDLQRWAQPLPQPASK